MEGWLKIDKSVSALIAVKAGKGYVKDEVIEIGNKKYLKGMKEENDLDAEIETIKAVRD